MRYQRINKTESGASEKVIKEYNRMSRAEAYQYERDGKFGLIYCDNDPFMQTVPDPDTLPSSVQACDYEAYRVELLNNALNWLKGTYPLLHKYVVEYYLSEENVKIIELADKYGMSKHSMSARLTKARDKIRHHILKHDPKNDSGIYNMFPWLKIRL